MKIDLQGKSALITGASRGIGRATALALAEVGADVIVTARSAAELETLADEIRQKGTRAIAIASDISDFSSLGHLVSRGIAEFGHLDILVNNAGICRNTPSEDVTDEEWRLVMSIDLDGVFYGCREVARVMLKQGAGTIINIGSMSGIISNRPQPQAAYNTAKAGVIHLTKSLAGEWASRGVRVNCISPGYIGTPMTKLGLETPEWRETWLSSTPMGRLGEPVEVASVAVFLASSASSFMTGSNVVVDGGYTSW